jgi:hypothetical protein
MSGRSNVVFWLQHRGLTAPGALVDRIFSAAKESATVLTEDEIVRIIEASSAESDTAPADVPVPVKRT